MATAASINRRKSGRMTDTRVPSVLAYVRVSTDQQVESGAGLEAQKMAILAEIERRGWQLAEWIVDEGKSGKSMARPGLQAALERLASGEADVLMASKLDRLSRSVKDFAELMDQAKYYGWTLVAMDLGVDTSTPAGEAMANVLATFAQFERRMIGQRTREGLAVKRAQGVQLGRRRELDPKVEAMILRKRAEGMTFRALVDELNEKGVPTATGGRWHLSTVQQIVGRAA